MGHCQMDHFQRFVRELIRKYYYLLLQTSDLMMTVRGLLLFFELFNDGVSDAWLCSDARGWISGNFAERHAYFPPCVKNFCVQATSHASHSTTASEKDEIITIVQDWILHNSGANHCATKAGHLLSHFWILSHVGCLEPHKIGSWFHKRRNRNLMMVTVMNCCNSNPIIR